MKSKLLIGFLIVQAFLLIGYFVVSKSMAAKSTNPKIVFEELTHDFGKVAQGTVLEHSYKFKNEGSGKLIVSSIRASCGCTGAVLDGKKEFEENETGEIKVTLNTQGREGIQVKTVFVTSNDSTQMDVVLTFKCEIYKNQ
ncbi:MAG TPA: DUF1573 domain-containing protein [Ignavibacteria bacterium]